MRDCREQPGIFVSIEDVLDKVNVQLGLIVSYVNSPPAAQHGHRRRAAAGVVRSKAGRVRESVGPPPSSLVVFSHQPASRLSM